MPDISDMFNEHLDLFRLDSAMDMHLGTVNFEARPPLETHPAHVNLYPDTTHLQAFDILRIPTDSLAIGIFPRRPSLTAESFIR